jgi:hypothetical protein
MSKYINKSIYFANDKSIFDALQSKSVTTKILEDFLAKKGIFLSSFDEKKDIVFYISRIIFDYYDYIFITEILEKPNQREKMTNCTFSEGTEKIDVTSACQKFRETEHSFDEIKVVRDGDKVLVEVKDTEVDFSKTELKQKSKKTYKFEFQETESGIDIRYSSNEKSQEILEQIFNVISDINGETIEPQKISLQSITSSKYRNQFFINLINSLPNHRLRDVTKIDIKHNSNDLDTPLEFEGNESYLDGESDEIPPGFIEKVSLMGIGVLESSEFIQLNEKGFFISKINWTAIDQSNSEGDMFEFEAEFGNPESCTNFEYIVKGVYRFNGETHGKSRKTLSADESNKKLKLVEEAAKNVYEKIVKDLSQESS